MSVEQPPQTPPARKMFRRYKIVMRQRQVLDAPEFTVTVAARSIAAAKHQALFQHPDACVLRVDREEPV